MASCDQATCYSALAGLAAKCRSRNEPPENCSKSIPPFSSALKGNLWMSLLGGVWEFYLLSGHFGLRQCCCENKLSEVNEQEP